MSDRGNTITPGVSIILEGRVPEIIQILFFAVTNAIVIVWMGLLLFNNKEPA